MSNLYTIFGDKGILMTEKINEILETIKPCEYDMVSMDLEEDSLISLLNEVEAVPFLFDYRVVVVSHPSYLYEKVDERVLNTFFKFLESPTETTILITIIDSSDMERLSKKKSSDDGEEKSSSGKKAMEALKSYTNIIKIGVLDEKDLDELILENLKGYVISNRAKEELKSRIDKDYNRLLVELEKLKIYKDKEKNITEDDVLVLVPRDLEDSIFKLTGAIIQHNRKEAMLVYDDLKKNGITPQVILPSLVGKTSELYQTKALVEDGYSKDDIADFYNIKSGAAYYRMRDVGNYSLKLLRDELIKMVNLEYEIKTGKKETNEAIELYILNA